MSKSTETGTASIHQQLSNAAHSVLIRFKYDFSTVPNESNITVHQWSSNI